MTHLDREAAIRARAHQIWEQEGRAEGQAEQHWNMAECEWNDASALAQAQATLAAVSKKAIARKGKAGAGRKARAA
ncbi:MAG: DUF2934 domain-containing protein [Methylobacterium mesophilicum]|nr:DUF2934 domain-containing protein [Methylobacterium mesophilicum]